VRRRRQPLQHAGLGEEQGAGADAEERALFGRVALLQSAEGADEWEGLGVWGVEDGFDGRAAGDDQDVVVADVGVRVGVVGVRFDGQGAGGGDARLGGGDGAFEGGGVCGVGGGLVG